jgi:hypothetical protein
VKSDSIGSAIFDASAARFVLPELARRLRPHAPALHAGQASALSPHSPPAEKRGGGGRDGCGCALGPDWIEKTKFASFTQGDKQQSKLGSLNVCCTILLPIVTLFPLADAL